MSILRASETAQFLRRIEALDAPWLLPLFCQEVDHNVDQDPLLSSELTRALLLDTDEGIPSCAGQARSTCFTAEG
ncbi:hypothetical protein [Sorangium sp. So ce1389]|uniref:hypothetical protein n=1 Tax=Sorangium sp. So ce1389 TaxID=3133336 RepID=UPI003F6232D5